MLAAYTHVGCVQPLTQSLLTSKYFSNGVSHSRGHGRETPALGSEFGVGSTYASKESPIVIRSKALSIVAMGWLTSKVSDLSERHFFGDWGPH